MSLINNHLSKICIVKLGSLDSSKLKGINLLIWEMFCSAQVKKPVSMMCPRSPEPRVLFSSDNFPGVYPKNKSCNYSMRAEQGKRVQLTFFIIDVSLFLSIVEIPMLLNKPFSFKKFSYHNLTPFYFYNYLFLIRHKRVITAERTKSRCSTATEKFFTRSAVKITTI